MPPVTNPSLPALVIGGPTASGKSSLALEIAKHVGGEVINADAFQLYNGLPILSAQPSPRDRAQAPHRLFGEIPLTESFDAARYRILALERISQSWEAGRPPILVGGTGLYLKAVLFGLSTGLPSPDVALRAKLETQSLNEMRSQLTTLDPDAEQRVDLLNPRRVIRALEVCILTGKPFTSFKDHRAWEGLPAGIWLSLPRETLHRRIQQRASLLFQEGVEDEVRLALPKLGSTSKQAIGIQPVADVIAGNLSEQAAIECISAATRQYARRQETWFRKESALQAVSPEEAIQRALELIATRTNL